MQVFYPFVLFYMIAAFLQGGAGTASMGMLNNLRQYLWIPITQDAFRQADVHSETWRTIECSELTDMNYGST